MKLANITAIAAISLSLASPFATHAQASAYKEMMLVVPHAAGTGVDAVARRPVVFIDDLGQEAIQTARSEWAMSWFMRFLDIRVSERLPLYVTTNLDAQGIAERGASSVRGDPMVRRLIEICEPIKFV